MKSTAAVAQAQHEQLDNSKSRPTDEADRDVSDPGQRDDQARIEQLAYQIYEERGRTDGFALDDWLEAETIVRQEGQT